MAKKSNSNSFFGQLEQLTLEGSIPSKYTDILKNFYLAYENALASCHVSIDSYEEIFKTFLSLIKQQCLEPFVFQPYHERIRKPFDHYQFGIDFIRPLVDSEKSSVQNFQHLKEIAQLLEKGDNIIFLANHQTEADPQAISILLENTYPHLAEEMIFVAGGRVITDPLAAPFSMGRNLLCIYSKRYIDHPPEHKLKKQLHNKHTMELMSELLSQGGKVIYVAPSGGRDRPNEKGIVEVAPFDPQSIEMFYLMAQRAGHPTHFYPMTLKTYALLPPPETIQVELGEERIATRDSIHIAFGPKIEMEKFPGKEEKDKYVRRQARANYIHQLVEKEYKRFL